VTGDFNHDGKTDIALAGSSGLYAVPIAFSNGDGNFNVINAAAGAFPALAAPAAISMIVTSGPPGGGPPDSVLVPDLVDLELGEALHQLSEVGLFMGDQHPVEDCNRVGIVLGQDFDPGSLVPSGSRVNVDVGQLPEPPRVCQ
jgi:hypothetical protein